MGDEDPVLGRLLEESAEELYEHAPCGYLATRPDGTILRVNETFEAWTGHRREALVGARRFQELLTRSGRVYYETHFAPLLQMQDAVSEIALELEAAGGRRLPVLVTATLRRDEAGRPALVRVTVFNATDRRRYERELLQARRAERAAREGVEHLQRMTSAIARAADPAGIGRGLLAELARTFEVAGALVAVADTGDPPALRVVAAHGDAGAPAPAALAERLRVATPDAAPDAAGDVLLPLHVAGRLTGALWLRPAAGAELDATARALLRAAADQCALALERARLFEHQRIVSHELQQSLLAGAPPEDPRWSIAAFYRPGERSLEVGGDWHDSVALGDGMIGVAVGDVVGRGLRAASAMGQLRSATRALAGAGMGPAAILEHLDRFVESVPEARMATLAYAEIDLAAGRVAYACAGHPPPLLLLGDGAPRFLWEGRSAPLGTYRHGPARDQGAAPLRPGDALLLYTDGIVERRREPLDEGLERLAAAAARPPGTRSAQALLDRVAAAMLPGAADDDVCMLCLDVRG